MHIHFKNFLLKQTAAKECKEIEIIQSLWSGYGKISRYQLIGSKYNTIVVKHISLGNAFGHPRGWDTDYSHQRKVKSYEIETHWYKQWNDRCEKNCRTPYFIGSFASDSDQWIILEDLDVHFPLRMSQLNIEEIKSCLKWLAHFHTRFLGHSPEGLWKVGTYWHLATRPDEFEKIEHPRLKAKAHLIDEALNQCTFQTIVHGDAKLANFCFSKNGLDVAVVDFQYVGGGCGMKDVAYFLGSCLSSSECELREKELLDYYFSVLKKGIARINKNVRFNELEEEWRVMYPIACTDFIRFLLGWMPTHQKINKYNRKIVDSVLSKL